MPTKPNGVLTLAAAAVVMIVAVGVRWSSLEESFWVDELHSAWCVWASPAEVVSRSTMGHQSPVWFAGLWGWKQIVGESEFALRMFSVLAVAIGGGVLAWGVGRLTDRPVAGFAAGLTLALESNALFFGSELRPYSAVLMFSSVATVCFLRLWQVRSRHDATNAWVGLIAAIGGGVLCQPTAAGVLVGLPMALVCRWWIRDGKSWFQFRRIDGALALATLVMVAGLWFTTLSESWSGRDAWATFATATHGRQLWLAWNWPWLWGAPLVIGMFSPTFRRSIAVLSMIVLMSTSIYFLVSYLGWMPIWHRRYFVAGLPIMAGMIGLAVASTRRADWVAATLLVGGMIWGQGALTDLSFRPVVVRGEDWRAAIRSIRGESEVAIDAGLIESSWLANPRLDDRRREYLTFVALGPYQTNGNVRPIGLDLNLGPNADQVDAIVTRRPAAWFPADWGSASSDSWRSSDQQSGANIRAFGGVTVIELPDSTALP